MIRNQNSNSDINNKNNVNQDYNDNENNKDYVNVKFDSICNEHVEQVNQLVLSLKKGKK